MVYRIKQAGYLNHTHDEEELILDVKWHPNKFLLWNITKNECWYGDPYEVASKTAINFPMLPFTIKKAQLDKYLVLV